MPASRDEPPAYLARAAAARARFLRELPAGYDPRRHLLIPNVYGGLVIAACLALLGRPGLAQWAVMRENPLTARVAVNRLWKLFLATVWWRQRRILERRVSGRATRNCSIGSRSILWKAVGT